jgi:hypothetical protein
MMKTAQKKRHIFLKYYRMQKKTIIIIDMKERYIRHIILFAKLIICNKHLQNNILRCIIFQDIFFVTAVPLLDTLIFHIFLDFFMNTL